MPYLPPLSPDQVGTALTAARLHSWRITFARAGPPPPSLFHLTRTEPGRSPQLHRDMDPHTIRETWIGTVGMLGVDQSSS
jgi:hypothetical protein